MPGEVHVKIAAVNFDATVFDSNDLSTIRGSSLRLLRAAREIADGLKIEFAAESAEIVYAGASEALLRLESPDARSGRGGGRKGPSGVNQQKWRATVDGLADEVDRPEQIQDLAADRYDDVVPNKERARSSFSVVRLAQQIEAVWRKKHPGAGGGGALIGRIDDAVREAADNHPLFCFAHAVDAGGAGTLRDILRRLDSRLRERQLHDLTVALPERVDTLAAHRNAFCRITLGRQPAVGSDGPEGEPISESARKRRAAGREARAGLYPDLLREAARAARELNHDAAERLVQSVETIELSGLGLARSFHDIVASPPDGLPPNVVNKLAVVYLDGNRFGHRREHAIGINRKRDAEDALTRVSRSLECNGGIVLMELLQWMLRAPDGSLTRIERANRWLRFETLLWGGDEMCFVLPAWAGWAFVGKLQQVLADLTVPWSRDRAESVTFATGMVLASYKSPIRELRSIAESLAYGAKDEDRDRNMVQVLALEGLDHAEIDLQRLRCAQFGDDLAKDAAAFSLDGGRWPEITQAFESIEKGIGRSQLHRLFAEAEQAGVLSKPTSDENTAAFVDRMRQRLAQFPDAEGLARPLLDDDLLAHGATNWPLLPIHHVLMLADYVAASAVTEAEDRAAAA